MVIFTCSCKSNFLYIETIFHEYDRFHCTTRNDSGSSKINVSKDEIFFRLQKKYGLQEIVRVEKEGELNNSFWTAFEATTFDEDEREKRNESFETSNLIAEEKDEHEQEEDEEHRSESEHYAVFEEEEREGEHVGYDGESDRSEEEEMNDFDREFLDNDTVAENPCSSHLALLNSERFADEESALDRYAKINLF